MKEEYAPWRRVVVSEGTLRIHFCHSSIRVKEKSSENSSQTLPPSSGLTVVVYQIFNP
jgi:hypothetical protein